MPDDNMDPGGTGLAVSGGGYRAMLFHLGAFWRLCDAGLLPSINWISSVSGGSITSAKLALEWHRVATPADFAAHVAEPIRRLASKTIDKGSIIGGVLLPGSVADRISDHYAEVLFGDATLQDLPDTPRFVINATNVETGKLWRFSKPYMGDYIVGRVSNPATRLADAVTASSAFPPVLSPFTLDVEPEDFDLPGPGVDDTMRRDITLTDGGVYDNLGLETVYKRHGTVLVSDAGGAVPLDASPPSDWLRHTGRVMDIIHAQVSSLRKRSLIEAYKAGERAGTYWGVGTDIADYALADAFPAPFERTLELARMPTRLKRVTHTLQERMINWGYAVSDAAIRKHWRPSLSRPAALPYPATGI
ncbi:MAG: patatin-like phospholipase family protein [Novosphingobium sp.]